jgi:hypothetical protein
MAQNAPNFYTELSTKNASVGQRVTLTFQLENAKGNIQSPQLPAELQVIYGPSQSQNFSYYNGVSSSSVTLKYVVTPLKEGELTIGQASVRVGTEVLKTKPVKLKVSKGSQNNSTAPAASSIKTQQDGNFIILVTSNKNSVYVNEPFTLTYTMYSRYNRLQPSEVDLPSPSNFWQENIELKERSWDRELAVINGKQYRKIIMAQRVMYPQKSGKLSTGVAEIQAVVNGGFFSAGKQISAKSNDFIINVKPLPKNAPTDFSGFNGKLNCSVKTNMDSVNANEAITYTIRLKGEGNFKLLNPPSIDFPDDFEVFEPKIKKAYGLTYSGYKGYIDVEYLLIPRYSGDYTIPGANIGYFDTDAKRYVNCEFDRKEIHVKGNTKNANNGNNLMPGASKNSVDNLNSDIRYIKEGSVKNKSDNILDENSTSIWMLRLGLKALFVLGLFFIKKQEDFESDSINYKASKASKKALKELKAIRKEGKENYSGIYKAYTVFLSDKFGIQLSDMKKDIVEQKMSESGLKSDTITIALDIIQRCEMASYAPNASAKYMDLLQQTEQSIKQLA